jgi:hypothetical protein
MPTPSKFTETRRLMVLELLSAGPPAPGRRRPPGSTIGRWRGGIDRGRRAYPGGRWRQFYLDVVEAEAHPRLRALTDRQEMTPSAAMAYLIEAGEFDPEPDPPDGPPVIKLRLPTRATRLSDRRLRKEER